MLAYSSVAQIGYIVLGVSLANAMGLTAGLFHLINHSVMKACLFLVAGSIVYRTGLRKIHELRNLSAKMPWTAAAFSVVAFSMIGIPPTAGFFSKLYLILGAINAEQWVFVGVILLSSILALAYFVNVIRYMYLSPDKAETGTATTTGGQPVAIPEPQRDEAPVSMLVPMLILAVSVVLLGLFNGEIVSRFLDPVVPASFSR